MLRLNNRERGSVRKERRVKVGREMNGCVKGVRVREVKVIFIEKEVASARVGLRGKEVKKWEKGWEEYESRWREEDSNR